jgi:beta-lactamase class A
VRTRLVALTVLALALGVGVTAGSATAQPAGAGGQAAAPRADQAKKKKGERDPVRSYPWGARMKAAVAYARHRTGSVSFAVVDERGRIHGFNRGRRYHSASLVKAMLLVAYLNQRGVRGRRLHGSDRALLGPMIRVSDNGAASAVSSRVGLGAMHRLARRAGMRRFRPDPVWGGSEITARDQARFFFRIRNLIPRRHRKYALGLLRRIVPGQRWGIPQGIPKGWSIHFKGGWYPSDGGWRVHQGALLRRGGRKLSLAVLTEYGPSFGYGQETLRGVTTRLLRRYPSAKR